MMHNQGYSGRITLTAHGDEVPTVVPFTQLSELDDSTGIRTYLSNSTQFNKILIVKLLSNKFKDQKFVIKQCKQERVIQYKKNRFTKPKQKENNNKKKNKKKNNESEILKSLSKKDNANIIKYVGTGHHAQLGCIVCLEYFGVNAYQYVKRYGIMNEEKAKLIVCQVANALKEMHDFGYVHKDIKPQNVLIRDITAKIIDFDGSLIINQNEKKRDRNNIRDIAEKTNPSYTPQYAPVELAVLKIVHKKVDSFGLGALLSWLTGGLNPDWKFGIEVLDEFYGYDPDDRCDSVQSKHRITQIQMDCQQVYFNGGVMGEKLSGECYRFFQKVSDREVFREDDKFFVNDEKKDDEKKDDKTEYNIKKENKKDEKFGRWSATALVDRGRYINSLPVYFNPANFKTTQDMTTYEYCIIVTNVLDFIDGNLLRVAKLMATIPCLMSGSKGFLAKDAGGKFNHKANIEGVVIVLNTFGLNSPYTHCQYPMTRDFKYYCWILYMLFGKGCAKCIEADKLSRIESHSDTHGDVEWIWGCKNLCGKEHYKNKCALKGEKLSIIEFFYENFRKRDLIRKHLDKFTKDQNISEQKENDNVNIQMSINDNRRIIDVWGCESIEGAKCSENKKGKCKGKHIIGDKLLVVKVGNKKQCFGCNMVVFSYNEKAQGRMYQCVLCKLHLCIYCCKTKNFNGAIDKE